MTITPYGFDGSLDERAWATMWHAATGANHVSSVSDWRVAAVPNNRAVTVAPGTAFSRGVLVSSDATTTLSVDGPSAGQWFLVAMAVDWTANTATPVVLPGSTTTTATPTSIPTSFPATFTQTSGSSAHMPLAWAWAVAGSTALILVDVRTVRPSYVNQGIWGPYGSTPTGPSGARDVFYNLATNNLSTAGRNYVQGATWFNTDTDRMERFYGLYSASNAGGALTPGWYPATTYDNYAINKWQLNSSADVSVSPAQQANLRTLTVTVQVPTQIDLHGYTNFSSSRAVDNVNIAGALYFLLDGDNTGDSRRVHTHGLSGKLAYPWSVSSRLNLTPGTHTINLRASLESPSSNGGYFQENIILGWSN